MKTEYSLNDSMECRNKIAFIKNLMRKKYLCVINVQNVINALNIHETG